MILGPETVELLEMLELLSSFSLSLGVSKRIGDIVMVFRSHQKMGINIGKIFA
jgi:hypothetical protein